jgi:ABC-type amino acid transport system permease subunit
LGVTNALVHVALHLPFVLRMGFAYIDGQKVCLRFVIVVKIYEVAYLAPEWRSGITSKNQNQRALPDAIA